MRITILLIIIICFALTLNADLFAQDHENVEQVGRMYNRWGFLEDIVCTENHAYIVTRKIGMNQLYNSQLHLLDISNPAVPQAIGMTLLPTETNPHRITVWDSFTYITCDEGLITVNVEDPTQPEPVSFLERDLLFGLCVDGNRLYCGKGDSTLIVLDISSPESPREIASHQVGTYAWDIKIIGDIAYLAGESFVAVDISDLQRMRTIGSYEIEANNFVIAGNYAFLAAGEEGVVVIDFSDPDDMREIGQYRMNALDLELVGDRLYVSYIIEEVYDGNGNPDDIAHIIALDISNPFIPREVCMIRPHYKWDSDRIYGIASKEEMLFIYNRFLSVIDLQEPDGPELIGYFTPPGHLLSIAATGDYLYLNIQGLYTRIIDISNPDELIDAGPLDLSVGEFITISGQYMYSSGLWTIRTFDIRDPLNPVEIDWFRMPENREARKIVEDEDYLYVATVGRTNGMTIIDCYDPRNLEEISYIETDTELYGFTIVNNYVYVAARNEGILVIDISNRADPREVLQFETPGSVIKTVYKDDLLYIVDLDFRIFDISDRLNPHEIAHVEIPGWARDIVVVDDIAYIAAAYNGGDPPSGIYLYDISNPSSPSLIGYCHTYGWPREILVSSHYVLSSEIIHLAIYDCYDALGLSDDFRSIPNTYKLLTAYPNPFNHNSRINIDLQHPVKVTFNMYDLSGRQVLNLIPGLILPAGQHLLEIDGEGLTAGTYLLHVQTGAGVQTMPVMLIK